MSDLASSVTNKRATEKRGPRRITQARSAIFAVVGITQRGPMGVATKCTSFPDYQRKFGGHTANNLDTIEPIRGFFEGGGQECHVVRTCHYGTPGDPTTATAAAGTITLNTAAGDPTSGSVTGTLAAPFALANGDTIIVDVDGAGNDTATFNATAAARTSTTGTYNLTDGWTLTFSINGGTVRTATFLTANFDNIAAATPLEVVNVLLATIATYEMGGIAEVSSNAVRIRSLRLGTGSAVNVTGGTANAALTFTTGSLAGTGDAANAAAVTVAELKTLIEGDIAGLTVSDDGSGHVVIASNTTGTGSSILVAAASTADDELGLNNSTHTGTSGAAVGTWQVDAERGAYSADITLRVSAPTSGAATDRNVALLFDSAVVKTVSDANMDPTSPRYFKTLLDDNTLGLTFTNLDADVASPGNLPALGTSAAMSGGSDGLTSLADADFSGAITANGRTGLRVFDGVAAITILAIPQRCTAAVQNAMTTWCDITRAQLVFAIIDPPAGLSASAMVTYIESTAALIGSTELAATYWPRVKVATPNADLYGTANVVIPPSGEIAAAYAQVDAQKAVGGAFKHPAGLAVTLPRVLGLEDESVMELPTREIVFPKRINPISRELDGAGNLQPFFLDGARVLKENGQFPHVGSSRGIQISAISINAGLAFARHANNTPELRATCADAVELYLSLVTKTGYLASRKNEEAFIVDFGPGLNPASAGNKVNGAWGVATVDPAEFVVTEAFKDERALEQELAAAA